VLHNSLLHLLLKNCDFLNTDISQGSIATHLVLGGVFKYSFVANFLLNLTLKEFLKSVNIWWSYGQEIGVLFFEIVYTGQSLKNVPAGMDVLEVWKSVPRKIRICASIFTSIFMLFYINIPFKLIVSDALRIAIKHDCIFRILIQQK